MTSNEMCDTAQGPSPICLSRYNNNTAVAIFGPMRAIYNTRMTSEFLNVNGRNSSCLAHLFLLVIHHLAAKSLNKPTT